MICRFTSGRHTVNPFRSIYVSLLEYHRMNSSRTEIYAKVPESLLLETPDVVYWYCKLYLETLRRKPNLAAFSRLSGLSYSTCRRLLKLVNKQYKENKK